MFWLERRTCQASLVASCRLDRVEEYDGFWDGERGFGTLGDEPNE